MAQYGTNRFGYDTYGLGLGVQIVVPILVRGKSPCFHSFNIDHINAVQSPTLKNVWNQYDEHGLTMSLGRLTGETNWEYKRRLLDVFTHIANSSYQGMVHGITRELGLSIFQPLVINPKVDSQGNFLAPDPYIRFDGAYLYLYSDYKNGLLDWAIDRFEPGGNYEHLQRLIDFINTTSFFEASLGLDEDPYTRSMTIVNQSNRVFVPGENVPASTRFLLENDKVIRGSVNFNDRYTFKAEVENVEDVGTAGTYHIEYNSGMVTLASVPPQDIAVSYEYSDYPFRPTASPVIVHDITNENTKVKMFNQVLQDDGSYINGIATELGVDVINELLSVVPMYWGV